MKYFSQNNSIGANKSNNKRCFSANGFSLLPLVLEQRLFCSAITVIAGLAIGLFACSNSTFATDPFLNVTVSNSITLDLKPISTTGTFAKSDTTSSTISATTNYFAGYTLGIAASSSGVDATNLLQTSGEGNEQTVVGRISSIGTVEGVTNAGISEQAFSDNSNTQYNNTWGYMLTKLNSSESTNYLPAPATTTAITLDTTNIANPETANNYNIAIGARVDTEIPKGPYTNTFVITAVANPIPYSITYNKNTEDNVTNMPAATSGSTSDTSITLPNNKPTRSGYIFAGWCSAIPVASGGIDSCGGNIYYQDGTGSRTFPISQISDNTNNTLYAMWQEVHTITFTAGNNIDTIMVADGSNKWRPYYASGGASVSRTVPVGTKLAVTVVPVADYILDSWTSDSGSTANLADSALLTTTYTVGSADETLTATGVAADYTDPAKSYTAMQNLTLANCSTDGVNVTDSRDGKSYTVKKIASGKTNFCFMLSNLRLDGGITLNSNTSNVTTEYVLPADTGNGGWVNDYCKPYMASKNGEYYYNWPAATTRSNSSNTSTCTTDADNSVGDICPANWALPADAGSLGFGNGTFRAALANNGSLITVGRFYSGSQNNVGSNGYWWSSTWHDNGSAVYLYFDGFNATRGTWFGENYGFLVRCMRSS